MTRRTAALLAALVAAAFVLGLGSPAAHADAGRSLGRQLASYAASDGAGAAVTPLGAQVERDAGSALRHRGGQSAMLATLDAILGLGLSWALRPSGSGLGGRSSRHHLPIRAPPTSTASLILS